MEVDMEVDLIITKTTTYLVTQPHKCKYNVFFNTVITN